MHCGPLSLFASLVRISKRKQCLQSSLSSLGRGIMNAQILWFIQGIQQYHEQLDFPLPDRI